MRRIDKGEELRPELVTGAAGIIRSFIEDYHERDEEQYVFPKLERAGKLVDLVTILRQQHQAGRKLTEKIQRLAAAPAGKSPSDRKEMGQAMALFVRMYEPHAAREDTVLFPAFRELVGPKELEKLQDIFEDKEKALPRGGFEKMVVEVARIEQALGIADLGKVTP
jgi:hemerythrin-like domain-containing protein